MSVKIKRKRKEKIVKTNKKLTNVQLKLLIIKGILKKAHRPKYKTP